MTLWRWRRDIKRWEHEVLELRMSSAMFLNGCACLIALPGGSVGMFSHRGARVNGRECLPFEVLKDRDEISAGGDVWCLSTLAAALKTVFSKHKTQLRCARCLGVLKEGETVSLCPSCRAHYHAIDCWTYDPVCAKCRHTTSGEPWVPDPLE
jgi:hypothetical protein